MAGTLEEGARGDDWGCSVTTETLDDALTKGNAGLFRKLAEVMAEVGRIPKSGYNSHHKYHYVTEADLVEAVREKLAARQVALIPSVEDVGERPSGNGMVTTAKMSFTFVDGESGATFTTRWAGQGFDTQDKGLYKAMTGAQKYMLMKAFLIATGDDPEMDQVSPATKQAAKAKPKAVPSRLDPDLERELIAGVKSLLDAEVWDESKAKLSLTAAGASTTASVSAAVRSLSREAAVELRESLVALAPKAAA